MNIHQQEIKTKDYSVHFDSSTSTVFFKGFLRLNGIEAYQTIQDFLAKVVSEYNSLILNFEELEFLNSSGVSMLSMFVVEVRNQGNIQLALHGSNKILWQTKSLRNLQRLMPSIKIELL
ncbi:hypothetical protein B6N60_03365 [Richelia sinica FACHB-800]|jgi:anti-anti-sigma factor|uniref:STAS domain-containing protein n=1 Tax=Richelia sinica FACHB-800 TaxID=1357546 RepID=A0A975Y5W8_9NOST|nr:STAS domain-containing protein [Richelia sinica]MBD2663473.1 hypothetical protein [Richelia sinica FACHB-800]QXE24658.1 hypothetical protein B6N60_03365 [Richelia sinica FACHB-800]